jgi:hypothetical protein
VVHLQPLGAKEVDTLLRRLEKEIDDKLHPDLKSRLREYSQGLPWLLKKFAGHLISEIRGGVDQVTLVGEALNIRNLFEADLAQLDPTQTEALKSIARYAPVPASEVMERVPAHVVNSLIDRRLIIQVGEQLDTYWDIFRDFLVTGSVPIEDSYILRQSPTSVWRLLKPLLENQGELAVSQVAQMLSTSENAIYNLSRELRLMGCLSHVPNTVKLAAEILDSPDREAQILARMSSSLRRHKAFSMFQKLAERNDGVVTVNALARQLPSAFPAVAVTQKTWVTYTRVFCAWFHYVGLAVFNGQDLRPLEDGSIASRRLERYSKRKSPNIVFPASAAGPAVEFARKLTDGSIHYTDLTARQKKAVLELKQVNVVMVGPDKIVSIVGDVLDSNQKLDMVKLEEWLRFHPGFDAGLTVIESDPKASTAAVGKAANEAMGGHWTETGEFTSGKYLRSWARQLGYKLQR